MSKWYIYDDWDWEALCMNRYQTARHLKSLGLWLVARGTVVGPLTWPWPRFWRGLHHVRLHPRTRMPSLGSASQWQRQIQLQMQAQRQRQWHVHEEKDVPSLDKDEDRHKDKKESTPVPLGIGCPLCDRHVNTQHIGMPIMPNSHFKLAVSGPGHFYMGLSVMAGFRSIMATFRRSVLVFWLFLAVHGHFWANQGFLQPCQKRINRAWLWCGVTNASQCLGYTLCAEIKDIFVSVGYSFV